MKRLSLIMALSLASCTTLYAPPPKIVAQKPIYDPVDVKKLAEERRARSERILAEHKAQAQANIPGESPTANTPSRPLKASEKKAIKTVVGKDMFDEVSARWEWPDLLVNSFESGGETMTPYCGYVNAKNRMGAYTGFTPFLVIMSGKQIASIGSGVDWMCEKYGYTR